MSLIPYLFRRFSTTEKRLLEIGTARTVKSTKNLANILEIEGIEGLKRGDIISAGLHKAWVFALYRDYSLAAILSDQSVSYNGEVKLSEAYELKVANSSKPSIYSNILTADVQGTHFKDFLKARPPYKHLQNSEQLMTGYQQIDICQPLSLGHSILFYGKSHKGKLRLAYQTAELFSRRENSKVVIVSPNPLRSKNHLENVIFYSASTETSEISQYLMPYVALNHACTLRDQGFDVLFILDDVIFHAFKEKSLFPAETLVNFK
jgi:F0F1-type ATP synthase alpha subunit